MGAFRFIYPFGCSLLGPSRNFPENHGVHLSETSLAKVCAPIWNNINQFSYNRGRIVLEISPAPPFNVGDTNAINGHEFLPQHWTGGKGQFFPTFETKVVVSIFSSVIRNMLNYMIFERIFIWINCHHFVDIFICLLFFISAFLRTVNGLLFTVSTELRDGYT